MPKYEFIAVDPKYKIKIDRMAGKYEMTIGKFVGSMVEYFEITGVNPKDQVVLSPAEELKKFRDTIISFMRKQEKDYILPVFGQMDTLIARFMSYLENEAPRRGDVAPSIFTMDKPVEIVKNEEEKSTPQVSAIVTTNHVSDTDLELEQTKLKVDRIKSEVNKIFECAEFKSTGLQKKIVVEMSQSDFDEIKKYVKNI